MMTRFGYVALAIAAIVPAAFSAVGATPQQTKNVVYAERHGVGLIMDIFTPSGPKNGLAIVDVVSGGWSSDRGKIRDHTQAQVFSTMCNHGYTVFAIRPGSISRFSLLDMVENLETGVTWVKQHAAEYAIDPGRIGIMGASAGGHLASLLAVRNGSSDAVDGNEKPTVKVVAVFFPPTDLLEYADGASDQDSERIRQIALRDQAGKLSEEEIQQSLKKISPAHLVTSNAPPFLIYHGTADTVVPLSHSTKLLAALEDNGVPAKLVLKQDGGHPWPTIHEEVAEIADWFDAQLPSE